LRVAQNADLMETISGKMAFDRTLLTRFPAPKSPAALVRKFKTKNKLIKRGLTGAESAEKERQIAKAIEAKKKKDETAAAKKLKKERIATEKAIIAAAKVIKKEKVKKA
jgi:hypothetical protein